MNRILQTAKDAVKKSVRDLVRGDGLDEQTAPAVKIGLRQLFATYGSAAASGGPLPDIRDTGFRVFSQFDEDGLILFLLAVGGTATRRYIDIGAADGLTGSNTANLAFNLGFHGLGIDGDSDRIEHARKVYGAHPDTRFHPPEFVASFVRRSTINEIIERAGFSGDVDVLSIDIDGNDYWIWEAIEVVQPRIVIVESRPELGREVRVVPYEEELVWTPERGDYLGASPAAFVKLGERKGYRLVGANRFGFNLLFVRQDLAADILASMVLQQLFAFERMEERLALFEAISNREFVHP